jgi:hypothetical protein
MLDIRIEIARFSKFRPTQGPRTIYCSGEHLSSERMAWSKNAPRTSKHPSSRQASFGALRLYLTSKARHPARSSGLRRSDSGIQSDGGPNRRPTTLCCRHSRERGNPVAEPMQASKGRPPGFVHWIPCHPARSSGLRRSDSGIHTDGRPNRRPTTPCCRHSRESGNPVVEPMHTSNGRLPGLVHWIPAFAGMTLSVLCAATACD